MHTYTYIYLQAIIKKHSGDGVQDAFVPSSKLITERRRTFCDPWEKGCSLLARRRVDLESKIRPSTVLLTETS